MAKIKVLVVDDSAFFRKRIVNMLEASELIEVIGVAINGKESVEMARSLSPDVITMDIEMPIMDGITAVKKIMAANPTPILMLSSLTREGTDQALDALDAGASDFLLKNFKTVSDKGNDFGSLLINKVRDLAKRRSYLKRRGPVSSTLASRLTVASGGVSGETVKQAASGNGVAANVTGAPANRRFKPSTKRYDLLAIGASTGGPVALQQVLMSLPANFPCPIMLAQHMPESFTSAFAERLNALCKITVKEAESGEMLKPGVAYLAPGGHQMTLEGRQKGARIRISDGSMGQNYAPCVDLTFTSIAKAMPGRVLGVLLTGMGSDGCEGARLMRDGGSVIWSQDKESCVVYGMPQAVEKAGISSEVFDIKKMGENIKLEIKA